MRENDTSLTDTILRFAHERGLTASFCPSEPARAFFGDAWRAHMPEVRKAAAKLADEGRIEVLQRGKPAGIRRAKGPVRLRLRS
ncbi:MAG: DUF3253 domain-containing protein [Candidatus Cyclonatronum sp.]|uniref:DUF3253 domain-containing protein n=1 Tax=Cyclonatronum sp. TaxID=3024185 RepID=UPI0025C3CE2C|nr:DUF3253 domain-containing protein [Cyclonatronum sp.]MCH8486764.1 DUF3253 domain-containing protein [Cyclonatronum sp.]